MHKERSTSPDTLPDSGIKEFYRLVDPEIFSTGFHKAVPGWISEQKNFLMSDFGLWYISAGKGEIRIDGERYSFETGDLITIKPGAMYQQELSSNSDPFQIYFTHILPLGRQWVDENRALARLWPLKISLLHRPEFLNLFIQLFDAYTTHTTKFNLVIKGLSFQLIDIIFSEIDKNSRKSFPRALPSLMRAKELIEKEYAGQLNLSAIAHHAGLSISHFSSLFTHYFGCPPGEYLLRARLREAKLHLARGERVKETAFAVGFQSQNYFSRLFKKRTGTTPTEFIKNNIADFI